MFLEAIPERNRLSVNILTINSNQNFIKLINWVRPGTISRRKTIVKSLKKLKSSKQPVYQMRANLELAIEKSRDKLGCTLIGYDAETFLAFDDKKIKDSTVITKLGSLLGLVW